MDPLIDPGEYAALAYCTYLNQASLGLIPRTSLEASVRFLADVAQHGNLRLSDQAEARVLELGDRCGVSSYCRLPPRDAAWLHILWMRVRSSVPWPGLG